MFKYCEPSRSMRDLFSSLNLRTIIWFWVKTTIFSRRNLIGNNPATINRPNTYFFFFVFNLHTIQRSFPVSINFDDTKFRCETKFRKIAQCGARNERWMLVLFIILRSHSQLKNSWDLQEENGQTTRDNKVIIFTRAPIES